MNQFLEKYNAQYQKVRNIERRIEKLKMQYHKESIKCRMIDMVFKPLAKQLAKYKGIEHWDVYGPFGIRGESTIYLIDGGTDICKYPTWSITLTAEYDLETQVATLMYDTGKKLYEYPRNSIGSLNNFGNERKILPDSIEEIAFLMKYNAHE